MCVWIIYFNSFFIIANTIQLVSCETGDIRLVGGTKDYEGRLEVCINQVWGTVCSRSWDSTDTKVACRQLGYQELGMLSPSRVCYKIIFYVSLIGGVTNGSSIYGRGNGPIMFGYMYCNGNENSLFNCIRSVFSVISSCSSHYYDLGIKCERKRYLCWLCYISILLFSFL